ncbi:unnamed protein product [Cuscuta epithymum]|uniref:Reverse transcriptase zinc-binding domain-containing protein n=1 Tax=Cuscuta epithymum TaxID=186058 RepID=A0AAV0GHF5_9ASTE|nr:unnamed protein product [Cuscuta epithymum]
MIWLSFLMLAKNAINLQMTITDYELFSGQLISKDKSFYLISKYAKFYSCNLVNHIFHINKGSFPFTYLGANIHVGRTLNVHFDHILAKFDNKLAGWKHKLLSTGGRMILINHVLNSLPLYHMAVCPIPKSIFHKMERRLTDFLWDRNNDHKKHVWRRWSKCCFPILENGLGFRSLPHIQKTFFLKLLWKLANGKGLWATWVNFLNGTARSVMHNSLESVRSVFDINCCIQVNNGCSSFWFDSWCDLGPLYQFQNHLLDDLKHLTVFEAMHNNSLIPAIQNCLPNYIITKITDLNISFNDTKDAHIWKPNSNGIFSFNSAYDVMRPKMTLNLSAKYVWNSCTPPKNSFFLWRLNNHLLPFEDKLTTFGIHRPFKCPFCNSPDTIDHCFLHCNFAMTIWHHFEICFGFHPNKTGTFSNYITKWYLDFKSTINDFNHTLPKIITWHLWKARNKLLYDNNKANTPKAIKAIRTDIYAMSVAKPFTTNNPSVLFNIHYIPTKHTVKRHALKIWTKPPDSYFKVNLASRNITPQLIRSTAIVRNSIGSYMGHATHVVHHVNTTDATYDALDYIIPLLRKFNTLNFIFEVEDSNVYEGLQGISIQHWTYWSQFRNIRRKLGSYNWTITHVNPTINKAADFLAYCCMSIKTNTHHFNHFVGILKFDATNFPYIT